MRVLEDRTYGTPSVDAALSVLLISPIGFDTLRETWRALSEQTVRDQLEIVLVTSTRFDLDVSEWRPFLRVVHVVIAEMPNMGDAGAIGVRRASAHLIARVEDHCLPRKDWAEQFIEAFGISDDAGIGPTVHSANPGSVPSDVNYTLEYAWAGPEVPKGRATFIPGHNSCYRRDVLLSLGDELGWWFESETVMHWELGRRGHSFSMARGPEADHWNPSRLLPSILFAWTYPRVFAARRRRLLSAQELWKMRLLWPAIPLARLAGVWSAGTARFGTLRMLQIVPLLVLLLILAAMSEGLGYWFGATSELLRACLDREVDRGRFLRAGEAVRYRSPDALGLQERTLTQST